MLDKIWDYLNLVRVYTKPKGQMPDYDSPVILSGYDAPTVERFVLKIHKALLLDFKHALVWGTSAKHNPQVVGKEHVLQDEDVLQVRGTQAGAAARATRRRRATRARARSAHRCVLRRVPAASRRRIATDHQAHIVRRA